MPTIYKARDKVKTQWYEMLKSGLIPIIEEETSQGLLTVHFCMSDYGVHFSWDFENSEEYDCGIVKPYFDGAIKKRGEGYVITFAEIDRMDYSLDAVLQFIWENVTDGVLSAYNLHV